MMQLGKCFGMGLFYFIFLKGFVFVFCWGVGGGGWLEDVFLGLRKLARNEALHSVRVVCFSCWRRAMSEQAAEATGKMEEQQYLRMWFESVDEDKSGSINSLELQVFAFLLSTSSFFSSSFYSV
jgi:hypothetical protein